MRFRLRLFGIHLLCSLAVLALVLGSLYLGWYRWPGWYLTRALRVVPILASVDIALGPLLTLLIANPSKSRRELGRDITIIATVQLAALIYGAVTLWQGRPLYYAFSEDRLQLVQASDIGKQERLLALQKNPQLAPYWYSLPRWVWAPLPEQASARRQIIEAAVGGGDDVIQMPRYFQSWERGLPQLRAQLRSVEQQRDFAFFKKKPRLKQMLAQQGFGPDEPVTVLMTGQSPPLLAVFDRSSMHIKTYLRSDFEIPRAPAPVE
ncbi:MAG TPA: hypothetical protein VGN77_00770 [Steroidobacteraceae bacterium]|nr:hypothetical protein [Steroidobacteraceae bacterium]